jgi:hypothetical protein
MRESRRGDFNDGLRHYPLYPGAVPVEPLTAQNSRQIHMRMPPIPPAVPIQNVPPHKIPPMQNLLNTAQKMPQNPGFPAPMNPAPPEKAAEQFHNMNKNLPDGVRYEPLDEDTMRILRQKIGKTQNPPQARNEPPSPAPPAMPAPPVHTPMIPPPQIFPAEAAEILKKLAQDERNANIFYSRFAKKESFAVLAKDSKARYEQITALLMQHFEIYFTPLETEINTEMKLSEAVALAISEENKGLLVLGNLLELLADTAAEKPLLRILNKKIIGHQLLLSMK